MQIFLPAIVPPDSRRGIVHDLRRDYPLGTEGMSSGAPDRLETGLLADNGGDSGYTSVRCDAVLRCLEEVLT